MDLIVLIGSDEEVRVAVLAGEGGRSGVRTDEDDVGLGNGLHDRAEHVGEYRPDHEIDLVAIDERLDLADGDVGFALRVGDNDFDLAAAELAAQRLDREHKAVAHLLADHRRRSRQGGDDADLEFFLGLGGSMPRARAWRQFSNDACLIISVS